MRPSAVPNVAATVLCLPDGRDVAFAEYGDPPAFPCSRFTARLGMPGLMWLVATIVVAASRRLPRAAFDVARRFMPETDRRVVDGVGFREWFIDSSRRASSTTARAMAQDLALFSREWRTGLDTIDIPVTIWQGTDDRLVEPSSADVLGAIIPHATLRRCPDEGHLLFADRVADILDDLVAAWPGGLERATARVGTRGPEVHGGSAAS